jgi:hypothetical protein
MLTRTLPVAVRAALRLAAASVMLLAVAPAAAQDPSGKWEGLVQIKSERVDRLYLRPGTRITDYKRMLLGPVEVSFDQNWNPDRSDAMMSTRVTNVDIRRIRTNLATEFRRIFAEELGKGGYPLIEEDGDDVLRIDASIVDLYINSPDTMTAGRDSAYVMEVGRMTLVAEFRDSVTGQVVALAVDTAQGPQSGSFKWVNGVTNSAEGRKAITRWATALVQGLDALKSRGGAAKAAPR